MPPSPAPIPIANAQRRGHWTLGAAALLLAVGVAGSLWAWRSSVGRIQTEADAEFGRFSTLTFANIEQRVQHQIDLLASFQALFRSGHEVSRRDFHQLFADLRVSSRFPGVQAVQYAPVVAESERAALEAIVRGDTSVDPAGHPGFTIHPPGPRTQYVPVVFNEPMQGNEAAFGHDSAQDGTRREAFERARDTGQPQGSAPLQLLQGRAGYVVRLPLYRHGAPLDSVEARRRALIGQISGVFLADALLRETVQAQADTPYRVTVSDKGALDGASASSPAQVLASTGDSSWSDGQARPEDHQSYSIEMGGRLWTVDVARPPVQATQATLPLLLLGAGLSLSMLLSAFVARLSWLYMRAAVLASQLSAEARDAAQRMDAVLDSTADGIVTIDESGRIVAVNRSAEAIFGLDRSQMIGHDVGILMPPVHARHHAAHLKRCLSGEAREILGRRRELPAVRADGTPFPIEMTLTEVQVGGQRHFVGTVRDLTEAKAAEAAIAMTMAELQAATDLRETMFRHAAFAIVMTDAEGRIQAMNPAAERLLESPATAALGEQHFARFLPVEEQAVLEAARQRLTAGGTAGLQGAGSVELELQMLRGSAARVPVSLTVSPLHADVDGPKGFLYIAYDVTERRQLAEQMARLAYTDGLTGLPNRLQLERELARALANAREREGPLALLFIDLDRFKPINDTHGHAVGDEVLREVARRLRDALRASDTAARIGGDEFVVLLPRMKEPGDSAVVADKLLCALSCPMQLGALELTIGASIGVVNYPEGGADADTLLRSADAAMYQAKQAGRALQRLSSPAP